MIDVDDVSLTQKFTVVVLLGIAVWEEFFSHFDRDRGAIFTTVEIVFGRAHDRWPPRLHVCAAGRHYMQLCGWKLTARDAANFLGDDPHSKQPG